MILDRDRIFPTQKFNSYLYNGHDSFTGALYKLLTEYDVSHKFKLHAHHEISTGEMSTPPMQLALLKFLIDLTGAHRFLEVGTFIGNTTMHVAKFMGITGKVVTIEKFVEFADLANKNFAENGLSKQIRLVRGDAVDIMNELPDASFDIVYVDGDKGQYLELTKIAEKKITQHGLIVIDDIFFHGDVLNSKTTTPKGHGCKAVIEHYKGNKNFSSYLLPIHNGILLLKKL